LQHSGRDLSSWLGLSRHAAFPFATPAAVPDYIWSAMLPGLSAFFHHERIRRLKSSAISAILIERLFKMK
jgi:hypothetical protein